jgi:hypothetical protein
MRNAVWVATLSSLASFATASCTGSLSCGEPQCSEGATECRGDAVVVCERGDNGCVAWGEPADCAPRSCSLGACSDTCTDECASGETRCAGGDVQSCGEGDSDPCADWLAPVACSDGDTCSNGACGGTCTDECAGTERRCSGDGYIECGDRDGDGCREYGAPVACADGQSCDAGACVPISECTDECTASGCDAGTFEACGNFDSDPCMDASAGTFCGASDVCTARACEATGCTSAPIACDSPPASTCMDADTLLVFDAIGTCALPGGCTYPSREVACPGCPACDACAGVTCNTPPNGCYEATGTCAGGSCTYPPDDGASCDDGNACTMNDTCNGGTCAGTTRTCNTPAAPYCVGSSVRTERAPGTCSGGTCTYPFTDMPCPSGCSGGMCMGGGCNPGPVTITTANPSPPAASTVHASVFDGRCGAAVGQIFPPNAPWNQSVRNTCVDPSSARVTAYLQRVVTSSQTFRIDLGNSTDLYGFNPLAADDTVTHRTFTPTSEFYTTHCDRARIPVPMIGRLEGEANYTCASDGDCHLTVFDTAECRLFEMWRANNALGTFTGGCLAVWTHTEALAANLRGLSCTSADAAGFPMMPMVFTPQEIRRGSINHALRFILPNNAVQRHVYVRPATHNPLGSSSGSPIAPNASETVPPYGIRLRLRPDFPTAGLSPGARAMVVALQEFGMFHADGGNVTFIASNDVYSTARWSDPDIDLGPSELRAAGMRWTDFQVVSDLSDTRSMATIDCSRTPLNEF